MKAALIDHDDSFTHNLRHWLNPLFNHVEVINHRNFFSETKNQNNLYDVYVLSPGPKHPCDYPQTLNWLKSLDATQAVFGVCLGLQTMILSEGGLIETYLPPLHGKISNLTIQSGTEAELLNPLNNSDEAPRVARYHSLKCIDTTNQFKLLASSKDDNIPMWFIHRTKKWMGVQFHPESFLTTQPQQHRLILKNWLNL